MSSNNHKYNDSKITKDWFPFKKYLFITDNHPIRQSSEKCSSSIEVLLSQQEQQQLLGMTNTLQCQERDALRIALYEISKDAQAAFAKAYDKAKAGSTAKGHEGRDRKLRFNLPKSERTILDDTAKQIGVTPKEYLRLAIVWLEEGIRDETIIRLTKSRRIGKDAVAKLWSRANQGKTPSEVVAKFKQALAETQELLDYLHEEAKHKRFQENEELSSLTWSQKQSLTIEWKEAERSANEGLRELFAEMTTVERMAWDFMQNHLVDYDTALMFAEEDYVEDSMMSKMTPKKKLEFLKQGKTKYQATQERLSAEARARADAKLKEASERWRRNNPITDNVDLEQRKHDMEAGKQIQLEEDAKDLEAFNNDPLMWDEDARG